MTSGVDIASSWKSLVYSRFGVEFVTQTFSFLELLFPEPDHNVLNWHSTVFIPLNSNTFSSRYQPNHNSIILFSSIFVTNMTSTYRHNTTISYNHCSVINSAIYFLYSTFKLLTKQKHMEKFIKMNTIMWKYNHVMVKLIGN